MALLITKFLALIVLVNSVTFFLCFSSQTPQKIKSWSESFLALNTNNLLLEWKIIQNEAEFNLLKKENPSIIIIDETYNLQFSHELQKYALSTRSYVIYTEISPFAYTETPFLINLKPSLSCLKSAYDGFLSYLEIQKGIIIWEFNEKNSLLINDIMRNNGYQITDVSVLENSSQNSINGIISRVVKPFGIPTIIIIGSPENCIKIQNSLLKFNMDRAGYSIVLGHTCLNNGIIDGSLSIVKSIDIDLKTEKESYINSLNFFVDKVNFMLNIDVKGAKLKLFDTIYQLKSCNFTVLNKNARNVSKVGEFSNGKLNISGEIQYPGNSAIKPTSNSVVISISANAGDVNPPGYPKNFVNTLFHQGTYFAVSKINQSKQILPNFILNLYGQINCGSSSWNYEFAKKCFLDNKNNMGIAFIGPVLSSITIATLKLFKELNITIPVIQGGNSAKQLSDIAEFPSFTRMVAGTDYISKTWIMYMNIMGWKSCVVLYADDAYDTGIYNTFVEQSESKKIKILNDEKYRKIPFSYNSTQLEDYRLNFQNAIDQNCNIFFIFVAEPIYFFVLESMYDLGVRRGDAIFLISCLSGSDFLYITPILNVQKTSELLNGILFLFFSEWVGDFGQNLQKEFNLAYPGYGDRVRCLHYDAVWAIWDAVNMLINNGANYEDNTALNWALRNVKFKGCSGTVKIEAGSNDRILNTYSLYNVYYDNSTNKWKTVDIGSFAPFTETYFKLYRKIVWPKGNVAPKDMKSSLDCPFRKINIQVSTGSRLITMGICIFISVVSISFAVLMWRKFFSYDIEMIQTKKFLTGLDYLMLSMIFIEMLQYQGIGPSFKAFNSFLDQVCGVGSLSIQNFIIFEGFIFWLCFYAAVGVSGVWILMNIIVYLRVDKKCENTKVYWICGYFLGFDGTLTLVSNVLFQPIASILLSITECDFSIDSDLTCAYLNYDCYLSCWNPEHLGIMIPTILLLCGFLCLAILMRPLWQECQENLNIKADPANLMIKSGLQIALISIDKTLRIINEILHGSIYFALMLSYLGFILYRKSFNFDRANLLYNCLIFCVIWNSGLSLLYMISNDADFSIWVGIQMGGLAFIMICGLIVKHKLPPSFLVRKPGKKIKDLFRFALADSSFINMTMRMRSSAQLSYMVSSPRSKEHFETISRRMEMPIES
ncbi:unnamed protein product [Blepharisma stoltei]|uniref:Receptor ligand binding region domain-containing protein n=1 Tax=Blepharisma stoltei TaxID=1481888 RepID=A0AAU9J7N7_9CILI|nr:unnamed protein product [Blepharisma stoltei]